MKKTTKATSEIGAVLLSMLKELPHVTVGKKLQSVNFKVGGKVFVFTKGESVVMKLPAETAGRLVESKKASLLVMGKRAMKEWVVIEYKSPSDSRKDLGLFKEAMEYVAGTAKRS